MRHNEWSLVIGLLLMSFGCGGDGGGSSGGKTSTGSTDDAAAAICTRICDRSQAAKCAGDTPDCEEKCQAQIDATPARCETRLDAFTSCAAKAKFTCDAADESEAKSCASQLEAYAVCLEPSGAPDEDDAGTPAVRSDAGTTPVVHDAGHSDAGGGATAQCAPAADDEACDTCLKGTCCPEISACTGECIALFDCATACSTEACIRDCVTASPGGVEAFIALTSCTELSCSAECT